MEGNLRQLAETFRTLTGGTLQITDGERSAADQADRLLAKIESGESITRLYRDTAGVRAVLAAHAEGGTRAEVLQRITAAIQSRIDAGYQPISDHIPGYAFDVRAIGMDQASYERLRDLAQRQGATVLFETKPVPHIHIQYPRPRQ